MLQVVHSHLIAGAGAGGRNHLHEIQAAGAGAKRCRRACHALTKGHGLKTRRVVFRGRHANTSDLESRRRPAEPVIRRLSTRTSRVSKVSRSRTGAWVSRSPRATSPATAIPDLAVAGPSGAPGRGILTGVVYLFRGSVNGLLVSTGRDDGDPQRHRPGHRHPSVAAATCGLSGGETKPECSRDAFGWALAIGRFGGGRYGDVVVGMGAPGRGGLLILRGGKGGISGSRSRMSYVNMPGSGEASTVTTPVRSPPRT